ncbi:squalene synthase HpnC [soil metagenome]
MPVDHYENFPVASWLLPARLRPAVQAIYRFARKADDIADEGDALPAERLNALAALDADLDAIAGARAPADPQVAALIPFIDEHDLPMSLFHDLLSAFSQDVVTLRYADFAAIRHYSRRSADPVGRLMLHLYDAVDAQHLAWSDSICSGLQFANFWQDVGVDWRKGRVYLPQDTLAAHGAGDADIAAATSGPPASAALRAAIRAEVARARAMLLEGAPLARALRGRIGLELRFVVGGGLRVCDRIDAVDADVFARRPKLGVRDFIAIAPRVLGFA